MLAGSIAVIADIKVYLGEQCQQFVTAAEQAQINYKRGDYCIHCMPITNQETSTEGQTQWV